MALGVNVTRRRLYFVMVRRDVLGVSNLDGCAASVLEALTTNTMTVPWPDPQFTLLPYVVFRCLLLESLGQIFFCLTVLKM